MKRYGRRRSVWLVQQGVWDLSRESMPLGTGYLKAAALADDEIRREMDIRIFNFNGGDSVLAMASAIFSQGVPDVLAFSVWGWNYRPFGHLAETFKQLAPDGWAVFGGNHVANQAERVFREFPVVDVVVNTEGEFVFRDLLRSRLGGRPASDLYHVGGVSFRGPDGGLETTTPPPRIQDLQSIPSPFLTGAIPLTDDTGRFRYDVALMETNRGCPYSCAFCYWGGAIGQKVRAFSRDRLRAELEVFARHEVHTIVLCDANFGMFKQDLEFVEDVVHLRERFGYPRAIETSWAKNKSKTFFDMVRLMKATDTQSSFALALQTLDEPTLEMMRRKNMKLNEWEDLLEWLGREGLDGYAELIWGAPGETTRTFLDGYDRLARHLTRIATYQLLILPNTEYSNARERFGLRTVRGDHDDFEYVLAHDTVSISENRQMQRFLLWARALPEHLVLRHIWAPMRLLAGLSQSDVIRNFMEWIEGSEHPSAGELHAHSIRLAVDPTSVPEFMRLLHAQPALDEVLERWWEESIRSLLPETHAGFLSEVFRYDCLTRPIYDPPDGTPRVQGLEIVDVDGQPHYRSPGIRLAYDVPALLGQVARGAGGPFPPEPRVVDLYHRVGFHEYFAYQEEAMYYTGRTLDDAAI